MMLKRQWQFYSTLYYSIHFPEIRETKENKSLFKGLFKGT